MTKALVLLVYGFLITCWFQMPASALNTKSAFSKFPVYGGGLTIIEDSSDALPNIYASSKFHRDIKEMDACPLELGDYNCRKKICHIPANIGHLSTPLDDCRRLLCARPSYRGLRRSTQETQTNRNSNICLICQDLICPLPAEFSSKLYSSTKKLMEPCAVDLMRDTSFRNCQRDVCATMTTYLPPQDAFCKNLLCQKSSNRGTSSTCLTCKNRLCSGYYNLF